MSLTNMVIMPGADYQAICDATRKKTGFSGLLKSGDIAMKIESISESTVSDLGNKLYSFGILSDIHVPSNGTSKTKNAISILQNFGSEFICMAGDIGHAGTVGELQSYKSIVDEVATVPIYSCTGNHDKQQTSANWVTYVGHDLNHVFEHENDVFILLSLNPESNTAANPYGDDNLEWLQEQFDSYKGRRIMLFMHYPLPGYSGLRPGTYYGFSGDSTEDDSILSMMLANRNVLHFSGHTHFAFDVEETYDDINVIDFNFANCATIHVPSANYTRDANNASGTLSQGYMAIAYENGIVIKAVDFGTGEYLEGYEYILSVKNTMSPVAGVIITSISSIEMDEGATETFTVRLSQQPVGDVAISLRTDANNVVTLDKTQLTFTPNNYATEQIVTVTATEDDDMLNANSVITVTGEGYTAKTVSVSVIDTTEDDTGNTDITASYSWEDGFLTNNGNYQDAGGYRTTPFDVTGFESLTIHVNVTGMGGSSSPYIYFYSSAAIGSDTFIERVVLNDNTTVAVPAGATCAILRSTRDVNVSLDLMDWYIYIDEMGGQMSVGDVNDPLAWEPGYMGADGTGNSANGFRTIPFSVERVSTFNVYVGSNIGGTSTVYVYFYSSLESCAELDSSGFIIRTSLTTGTTNTVSVPDGALYARIRSTANPAATLDTIGDYIYLVSG